MRRGVTVGVAPVVAIVAIVHHYRDKDQPPALPQPAPVVAAADAAPPRPTMAPNHDGQSEAPRIVKLRAKEIKKKGDATMERLRQEQEILRRQREWMRLDQQMLENIRQMREIRR